MVGLAVGVILGLVIWIYADWRYFFRWSEERERLRREGRWAELRAYIDRNYRTRRPLVRFAPGTAMGIQHLASAR
jgi:hypothetical protein